MRLTEFSVAYLALGAALALLPMRRRRAGWSDAVALLLLWPLYAPLLWMGKGTVDPADPALAELHRLQEAITHVADPSIRGLLPDHTRLLRLEQRMTSLTQKIAALDEVLAQESAGNSVAASVASLSELRRRALQERDTLRVLCGRLRGQVLLLRFTTDREAQVMQGDVSELVARLEGVEEALSQLTAGPNGTLDG